MTNPIESDTHRLVARVAARTDRGRKRPHNEDAFAIAESGHDGVTGDSDDVASVACTFAVSAGALVFVVADGMGGGRQGKQASRMAVEVVVHELRGNTSLRADDEAFAACVVTALERANTEIFARSEELFDPRPMGTTATAVALASGCAYAAHVGDSRAYLVRDGRASQLTKDQTFVQTMVDAGVMTLEEAATSDRRHVITQALGATSTVEVDLTRHDVRGGDVLVLCSDGLTLTVTDDEIAAEIGRGSDPAAACDRLILLANERGGADNVTVLVVYLEDGAMA